VVVKSGNGSPIIDANQSELFAAHLRLAFQKDEDFIELVAPQIHYARDRPHDGIVGMHTNALIAPPGTSKYQAVPAIGLAASDGNGLSSGYNAGYHERQGMMMKAYAPNDGTAPASLNAATSFNIVLNIPIKVLHDFLAQLDFPMIANPLVFEFWLNNQASGPFRAVTLGTAVEAARTQAVGTDTNISVNTADVYGPRLYYHAVQWQAGQLDIVSKKLMAGGLRKVFQHRKYELYSGTAPLVGVASGSLLNYTVSTSATAPRRLWILCYPNAAGGYNSCAFPSVLVTGANGFSSLQVAINGQNQFNNPLMTLEEQYDSLCSACSSGGDGDPTSLVPYFDFQKFSRIHCVDLSRASSMMADSTASVTIAVQSTIAGAGAAAVDVVFLLESEQRVVMNMSGQSTAVTYTPAF
jgi:hypothetical protein